MYIANGIGPNNSIPPPNINKGWRIKSWVESHVDVSFCPISLR